MTAYWTEVARVVMGVEAQVRRLQERARYLNTLCTEQTPTADRLVAMAERLRVLGELDTIHRYWATSAAAREGSRALGV